MLVSTQNPYVEILTPTVMVFGGVAFRRRLSHEDRALMNGMSALITKDPGELSHASCHVRMQ